MNKIVLEHYPASKLPEELREGIAGDAAVTVTVEVESREPKLSWDEMLELVGKVQAKGYNTSLEESVTRVRELRDEWD